MSLTKKLLISCLFVVALGFITIAQNKRPKIGLVLSGGGAKGMAHIGVLKALEEAGITPDFITGTSMGSIMGGLYSIGYSADELDSLVTHVDWDLILTNKVPLDKVTFEEKQFYGRYLLDLFINNKELEYPSGVIDGQALMALFSDLTRSVHNIHDFSKLPIPFACVAANIETGEPVVLNKGSLALSMRASMAIPSVFTPVMIDGKLLVDGGLVHNMPVQEAIDMGADIIIGVFVGTDLNPASELKSMVKILAQSAFITSARDAKEELVKCDILIRPDLEGYSTASFHDADSIVARGMKAGQDYLEVFRQLADSLKRLGPFNEVKKPEEVETYTFDKIEVEGNKEVTSGFITGRLGFNPGEEVTLDKLNERIDFIFGTQYFRKINYEILGDPGDQTLKVIVEERPDTHFRLSYYYDTDNKGGIILNLTLRNILMNSSRLILEGDLSAQPSLIADYFKYIGKKQNVAIGLHGLFNNKDLPLYDENWDKAAEYRTTYYETGLKIQSTRLRNSTFGAELNWAKMNFNSKQAVNNEFNLTKIDYQGIRYGLFYQFNNLDQRYFPTSGMTAMVRFTTTLTGDGSIYINDVKLPSELNSNFLQTSDIHCLKMELAPVIPLSSKTSLIAKARLSLSTLNDGNWNLTEYDYIGGFTPDLVNSLEFYGWKSRQKGLANYFYSRFGGQYELKRNMYLQAHINYISTNFLIETLNPEVVVDSIFGRTNSTGYALMFGMLTPIGPAEFMVAKDHYMKGLRLGLRIGFY